MITLIPSSAHNYTEFWEAIRKRNLWFIRLRYMAFIVLSVFILFSHYFFNIKYSTGQFIAIAAVSISILVYNIILHRLRKYLKCEPGKFNPLYFSLLQMILDLTALLLLVYFTGGIESPLYMFFVFHMIIGSLILPGLVVYSMAAIVFILFALMVWLEHFGAIPQYHLVGMIDTNFNSTFAFFLTLAFGFTLFISVYLANGIAKQLYKRERDLVDSIDKINSAEKEKQKYIMGIVHELKTPLAAVSSYLDLILQKFLGPVSEEVEEKIARAKFRTDEGIEMINDVLNVSKLKLYDEFDTEEINLEELLCSIVKKRKVTAEARLISFTFRDERAVKKKIKGDKFLLGVVFSNLIGNAIKYGVDDGNVFVALKNKNGKQVVEICDDGIGIAKEEQPKIFNDFYRAANAKKISTDGSGLGLSVVKQIVERHKGIIEVKSPSGIGSSENPGTCFSVIIPTI